MKKTALFLSAALMTGMLFGVTVKAEELSGDVDHIVMTYMTLGTTPTDLQMVQDALNERSTKEIGVEVELKPVSAYDAMSQFTTWLGTGERFDLMFPLLQDLNSYIDQGLIEPITDLIKENAPYIQQMTDEGWTFASNNTVDGEIWSVLQIPNVTGSGGGFKVKKELVDETDWEFDPEKIYTLDELGELFAAIKENHPDMYPCGEVGSGASYDYVGIVDNMGNKSYTGGLIGTDSTTVVNIMESDGYKDYIDHMREWNQKGYVYPDAATTDSSLDDLKNSGVSAGYFMMSAPVQKDKTEYMIRLTDVYQNTQGMGGWVVPLTAEEPEAAIRFLDYMYKDPSIANLLQWGIEGKHYVVLDKEKNLIGFPEGVDANNSGYYNTLGLYGDTRYIYTWSEDQSQEENDAYTQEAMSNKTKAIGMIYSPSPEAQTKIAALASVYQQYAPALETGSVDVDQYYEEFISAMKAAGIDDVIAEKQEQLDAFLASK